MHARPHGGESVAMLRERVLSVFDHILKARSLDAVLCVTHSGVIRAAMARGDQSIDFDLTVAFGGSVVWNPH
jgi:alpha-ribazole phosphatase